MATEVLTVGKLKPLLSLLPDNLPIWVDGNDSEHPIAEAIVGQVGILSDPDPVHWKLILKRCK